MTTENPEAPKQQGAAAVACTDWLGRRSLDTVVRWLDLLTMADYQHDYEPCPACNGM